MHVGGGHTLCATNTHMPEKHIYGIIFQSTLSICIMDTAIKSLLYGFIAGEACGRSARDDTSYPTETAADGRQPNDWGDHTDQLIATLSAVHMNRNTSTPFKYDDIYKTIVAKYRSINNTVILRSGLAKNMAATMAGVCDFAGQFAGQTFGENYDAIPRALVAGSLSRFRTTGYQIALHMCKITHNTPATLCASMFVARVVSLFVFGESPLDEYDAVFASSASRVKKQLAGNLDGRALCVFPEINRCIISLRAAIPLLDRASATYADDANKVWLDIVQEHTEGVVHAPFIGAIVGAIAAAALRIVPHPITHLPAQNTLGPVDLFLTWHGTLYSGAQ